MIYTYYCLNTDCNHFQDENHRVDGFKEFKPFCEKCSGLCEYRYTPSVPQVAFRDGPTGSWPSKGDRFQNYRRKRDSEMKKRQLDRYGPPKELIPNFAGQQTESWAEASSLASKDTNKSPAQRKESVKTFESRVKKEPKKIRA